MLLETSQETAKQTLSSTNLMLKEGWLQVRSPKGKESIFYYSTLHPYCLNFYADANERSRWENQLKLGDCLSITKTFCMYEKPSISMLMKCDGAYLLTTELHDDIDDWIEKLRAAVSAARDNNPEILLRKFSQETKPSDNPVQVVSATLEPSRISKSQYVPNTKVTNVSGNRSGLTEPEFSEFALKYVEPSDIVKINQQKFQSMVKNNGCHDKTLNEMKAGNESIHEQVNEFTKNRTNEDYSHVDGIKAACNGKQIDNGEAVTTTKSFLVDQNPVLKASTVSNWGNRVVRERRTRKESPWMRNFNQPVVGREGSVDGLNMEKPCTESINDSHRNLPVPNENNLQMDPYIKKSNELLSSTDSNYATAQLSDATPNPLNRYPPITDLRKSKSESPFEFLNSSMPPFDSNTMPPPENGMRNGINHVSNLFLGGSPKMLLDPAYASSMFTNIMELWNFLLQEERNFWQFQLCNILNSFGVDTNEVGIHLNEINQFHSEKIATLWKRVYEHWVPRDYLEYLSDEMRQVCTTFNLIIDKLFMAVEELGCMDSTVMNNYKKTVEDSANRISKLVGSDRISHSEFSNLSDLRHRAKSMNDLNKVKMSKDLQESHRMWSQIKDLMRDSHHRLLEQVRHVVEMVGAALDADMEDTIIGAQNSDKQSTEPFTGPPDAGLRVVAKLHAVAIDLESRLEAVWQNTKLDLYDSFDDLNVKNLPKEDHLYELQSGQFQKQNQQLSDQYHDQLLPIPIERCGDGRDRKSNENIPEETSDCEKLFTGEDDEPLEEISEINENNDDNNNDNCLKNQPIKQNLKNEMIRDLRTKPVWAVLKNKPRPERVNSPIVWVFQDFEELEKYRRHAVASRCMSTVPVITRETDQAGKSTKYEEEEDEDDVTLQMECERA